MLNENNFPCNGAPIQDYPLNCGAERDCPPRDCSPLYRAPQYSGGECSKEQCSVVPPPIPPVRYVPGVNVQEQLCNMASHVNVAINRWNEIQRECYKALDQVVGAAVNNDVYYAPDEVRFMEGYSEDAACAYSIVEARAVDRSGKPIFCHLRPAYNNETNSGARELITDVSFVTSAQMVLTAVQATETRWNGTSVFNCNPGNSQPDDTVWVAGWNRNGVLRFFRGDVGQDTLRQNRMVSCIGPVFPIIKDGAEFTEVLGSMGEVPGSIQAMGWKSNGNKVFFSCGVYDQPGMTPMQVVKILQGIGCMTAVITSYQSEAATRWDATPIAGTENTVAEGGGSVVTAPGVTGGMTFLGRLTAAPIQWNIPANCANWVISKKPQGGWKNAFTTEVANVVQNMGGQENKMNSILGQLKGENEAISKLEYQVQVNTDDISELKVTVGGFDTRIVNLEKDMDTVKGNVAGLQTQVENEITLRDQQYRELVGVDAQERAEREAADAALRAALNQETSARESQDRVLQNNIDGEASERRAADAALKADIDTEATTRANADRNLQNAIEAEQSARSTKDTQHEARMDALQAEIEKNKEDTELAIENITNGSSLPLATTTAVGVVKVGRNLTVEPDGTLNAEASGGGDIIVAGPGVMITPNTSGEKVVSIDESVVVNEDQLAATNANVTRNANAIEAINQSMTETENNITGLTTRVENTEEDITNITGDITTVEGEITTIKGDIANIMNGSDLPIASATQLGAVKVGANLSIADDGTLNASGGEGETGETVSQGAGITVTHDTETNVATVSLSTETQSTLESVKWKANQADLESLQTTVAGKANKTDVDTLSTSVSALEQTSQETTEKLATVEETANTAASGVSALNSNVTALTATVNTNTQNIDANTTAIATVNGELDTLKADVASIDDTATAAMDHAASAEEEAAKKVNNAGDTMTGSLILPQVVLTNSSGEHIAGLTAYVDETGLNVNFKPDGLTDKHAKLTELADPTEPGDAATKNYTDNQDDAIRTTATQAATAAANANSLATQANGTANEAKAAVDGKVSKSGDTMTGALTVGGSTQVSWISDNTVRTVKDTNIMSALTHDGDNGVLHLRGDASIELAFRRSTPYIMLTPSNNTPTNSNSVVLHGIRNPQTDFDAANKLYVDSKFNEFYSNITFSGATVNESKAQRISIGDYNVYVIDIACVIGSTRSATATINVALPSHFTRKVVVPLTTKTSVFHNAYADATINLNSTSLSIILTCDTQNVTVNGQFTILT